MKLQRARARTHTQQNKHAHTHIHTHIYIYTHTHTPHTHIFTHKNPTQTLLHREGEKDVYLIAFFVDLIRMQTFMCKRSKEMHYVCLL
jgi:hypothetical protein